MRPFLRFFFIIFLFLSSIVKIFAQNNSELNYSYEEIEKRIDESHNSKENLWKWINLYIKKSKIANNSETILYSYRYASKYSEYPINFKYADSALIVARKTKNEKLLSYAYLNRGTLYMDEEKYNKALDDILLANNYSKNLGDDYTYNKTK